MRILIVTGIFPPDIGGPATYVPKIATYLTRQGHNVRILTLSDDPAEGNSDYPFEVVRIRRSLNHSVRVVSTITTIVRLARKADVLYVNGLYLETAVANLISRKPEVHKVVGDLAWERSTAKGWVTDDFETYQAARYGWKVSFVRWLRSWWSKRADRIIVPSKYLSRWVKSWAVLEDQIDVVYNGMDFYPATEKADPALPTSINVVTVARLVSWKRVDGIIDAVSQLDDVGLIVIGDGPLRHDLEEHALRAGIADRVFFAGTRDSSEIPAILSACDVFVLNSTYEGLPHVVLEAMAAGLPVLATAVGGTPEVVQNETNGLLIDSNDPDGLLKALSRLIAATALRRKIAERGAETVRRFTDERMFEQTEDVLSRVATPGTKVNNK